MIANLLRRGSSGVAVVETAAVISFTLLIIFGMIQMVLIGYYQVAGDAATFMYAHEYTLGVPTSNIANAEASMVPAAIASNVTETAAPPPDINASPITTMYGNISPSDRTGGYTLVRPQNLQVYLSDATYGGILPFKNIPITSGAVEGYYLMANDVMNNSGLGPNDPSVLNGNVLNPANASPFLGSSNLANNMNVPPYYAPNAYWQFCSDPWVYRGQGGAPQFGDVCEHPQFWGPGLAEYLDNNNYAPSGSQVGVNAGDTFAAMAVHQRVYADLIAAFPPMTTAQQLLDMQLQFANYNATAGTCSIPEQGAGNVNLICGTATNGCNGTTKPCGASWLWSNDPNFAGLSGTAEPLYYYDPLNFWVANQGKANATYIPTWMARGNSNQMWATEPTPGMDGGNDAETGPSAWNNVSIPMVYEWDQPHGSPNAVLGTYYTNPLAGGEFSGDPAY